MNNQKSANRFTFRAVVYSRGVYVNPITGVKEYEEERFNRSQTFEKEKGYTMAQAEETMDWVEKYFKKSSRRPRNKLLRYRWTTYRVEWELVKEWRA